MNAQELFLKVVVGDVIQIVWTSALFDPEAVIKPGTKSLGPSRVFSCGFVADIGTSREYITLGIDSMVEAGQTNPSYRTTLTIPASNIVRAEIYGKVLT